MSTNPSSESAQSTAFNRGLAALQFFIGVGGVSGGVALIMDPSGEMLGLAQSALAGTPFGDYFYPGLVLFLVNGLGSIGGSLMTLRQRDYAAEAAIGLGLFLVAWIVVQLAMVGLEHWIQPLFLIFGLLEVGLGWRERQN